MEPRQSDLEAYVDRCRSLGSEELPTRRAVQLRVVEPLLELLGWDLRGAEVEPDVDLGGSRVDYLLRVGDRPAVAVATAPPETDLGDGPIDRIASAVDAAAVDWAVLTNARQFALLAHSSGEVHRRIVPLDDLPGCAEDLARFTRTAARDRHRERGDDARARERLADRRDAAVDAVTRAIVDVAGDGIESSARAAAADLVDDLALPGGSTDALADANASEAGEVGEPDAPSSSAEPTESSGTGATDSTDAKPTEPAGAGPPEPVDERGEYVVRLFSGGSTVGAVGTETPGGTLAGVVAALGENHGLAETIELPWGVHGGRALLAPTPEHPDGSPMEPHREVGGVYAWTGVDGERAEAAIEALAEATGLRAMFQGDW